MDMNMLSIIILILSIYVSFKIKINTGLVGIAVAFALGFFVYEPGQLIPISGGRATTLLAGWNAGLFFTIFAVTFLFAIATANGTLEIIIKRLTYYSKGNRRYIPILFFFISIFVAAIGPGSLAAAAMMVPLCAVVALDEEIEFSLMLMAGLLGCGAGGISPMASTGIVAASVSAANGIPAFGLYVFGQCVFGATCLFTMWYIYFGGWKLKKLNKVARERPADFNRDQLVTMFACSCVILAAMVFRMDVGLSAFTASCILLAFRMTDEKRALAGVPWGILLMVCGVGVLINVVRLAGGIKLMTDFLAMFINNQTIGPIMLASGGVMSSVSSAQGVVIPTLVPMVPAFAQNLNVDPVFLVTCAVWGAHTTSVSPFSPGGAIGLAMGGDRVDREKEFKQLIICAIVNMFVGMAIIYVGIVGWKF